MVTPQNAQKLGLLCLVLLGFVAVFSRLLNQIGPAKTVTMKLTSGMNPDRTWISDDWSVRPAALTPTHPPTRTNARAHAPTCAPSPSRSVPRRVHGGAPQRAPAEQVRAGAGEGRGGSVVRPASRRRRRATRVRRHAPGALGPLGNLRLCHRPSRGLARRSQPASPMGGAPGCAVARPTPPPPPANHAVFLGG